MSRRARIVPIHAPKPAPIHPFDRTHHTDTGGLIERVHLLTGHPNDAHITAYYGIAPSILDGLIDLWLGTRPRFAIDHYTFLDIGAGKGRAVLTASLHPFQHVTGIELNPALATIAQANLALFPATGSPLAPATIQQGDALEAALPATPTLAFLFHPFEAPVLRKLIRRFIQHFRAAEVPLDILYCNAEHATLFDAEPAFTRLFHGMVPMSPTDHLADLAEIAEQTEYGSTGDEICAIYRLAAG